MNRAINWRTFTPHELAGEDKSRLVIGPFGSSLKTSDYQTEGVPLIFVRDIRAGDFRELRKFVSQEKADQLRSHLALPGDVLVTKMGDPPGDSSVYTGREPAVITADCIRLRPTNDFDAKFVSYAFQAPAIKRQIERITSGVAQRKVSLARFRTGLSVPVPPLHEQRRIVDLLEDHLSRLDAADSTIESSVARLRILKESALSMAVTAATADPRCVTATLGALATVGTGLTPLKANRTYYEGGTIPWITSGDLHQGVVTAPTHFVTEAALEQTGLKIVAAGALLVAMYGEGKTRGTAAVLAIDGTTNQACASIVLREPELRSWVKLILDANYAAMRRLAAGGVQPNLNLSLVRALEIPVPTEATRESLIGRLQEIEESATRLRESLNLARRRATKLRHSLLAAAFSGRLTGTAHEFDRVEEAPA